MSDALLTITVTRSARDDGAVVVFIDTTQELADLGGLRIRVNDNEVFGTVSLGAGDGPEREALAVEVPISASEIAYVEEADDA